MKFKIGFFTWTFVLWTYGLNAFDNLQMHMFIYGMTYTVCWTLKHLDEKMKGLFLLSFISKLSSLTSLTFKIKNKNNEPYL